MDLNSIDKERLRQFERMYNTLSRKEIEEMKDNVLFLSFYYSIRNYECFHCKFLKEIKNE